MNENYKKIELLVKTDFERELLKAVFLNLEDTGNKLKYNNFSYSLRELLRHILYRISPNEHILNCTWYKDKSVDKENGITRRQRIKYAIQGGLSDVYLKDKLELSFDYLTNEVVKSINSLSKFTHVNEKTFGISNEALRERVDETADKFLNFFNSIISCRNAIINRMEENISESINEHTVTECIEEIDMLSTHHNIESISIDKIHITEINSVELTIEVDGSLDVRQQWGSNGDVKKGDGLVSYESFPFSSILKSEIKVLPEYSIEIEKFNANTELEISDCEINRMIEEQDKKYRKHNIV